MSHHAQQEACHAIRGEGAMDPDFERGAVLQHVTDSAYASDADRCRSIDRRQLPPGLAAIGDTAVAG